MELHVGIDDTDTTRGGCTTHLAASLVPDLEKLDAKFLDYPNLVRLNPNVPFKTRGNGAIALRLEVSEQQVDAIRDCVFRKIEDNARTADPNADPAAVVLKGPVPPPIKQLGESALRRLLHIAKAVALIRKYGAEAVAFRDGLGLVGALAAIGVQLEGDHTFELIAYRDRSRIGTRRKLVEESVVEMDRKFGSCTFNNLDPETGRILVTPRGNDPILCGIRGEDPSRLIEAFSILQFREPVSAWTIFRTNQGTDAHLNAEIGFEEIEAYSSVVAVGNVASNPTTGPGGHVFFSVTDGSRQLQCAAYEPTGPFRWKITKLRPGDTVRVFGCIRKAEPVFEPTLNLEKLEVVKLADRNRERNPVCANCRRRMESAGRGQGFRCTRCGNHDQTAVKMLEHLEPELKPGLYLPPPRAQRHLTKPLRRYGHEKTGRDSGLIQTWHFP